MRVLLTGSSGWLGRTLAPLLTENGHAVTGLDVVPGTHTQVIGTVADRTLIDMAARRPLTRWDFGEVHGVGESKLQQFADVFLAEIKSFVQAESGVA